MQLSGVRIHKIYQISPMCRLCGEREETISHIVAECTKLAQKQYRHWRHDRVALVIRTLCKRFGFPYSDQWYEHVPERELENENVKLLWDFSIQTDHHLEHNKPDILIHEKTSRQGRIQPWSLGRATGKEHGGLGA